MATERRRFRQGDQVTKTGKYRNSNGMERQLSEGDTFPEGEWEEATEGFGGTTRTGM